MAYPTTPNEFLSIISELFVCLEEMMAVSIRTNDRIWVDAVKRAGVRPKCYTYAKEALTKVSNHFLICTECRKILHPEENIDWVAENKPYHPNCVPPLRDGPVLLD